MHIVQWDNTTNIWVGKVVNKFILKVPVGWRKLTKTLEYKNEDKNMLLEGTYEHVADIMDQEGEM